MKYIKTYETKTKGITFQQWLISNTNDINTTKINCSRSSLNDLNGIEKFIKLEVLNCSNNQLKELPDLSNLSNLKELYCSYNQLKELPDLSNLTNLQYLSCYNNQLKELPDLSNLSNLKELSCYNNQLPYNDLKEYLEWHKKEYPWIWDAKKYNL